MDSTISPAIAQQEPQAEVVEPQILVQANQVSGDVHDTLPHVTEAEREAKEGAQLQSNDYFVPVNNGNSEITFQKRQVPKQRTQSVQSVLSSVSLRSFVHQKAQQVNQQQQSQQQLQQQQQQQQQQSQSQQQPTQPQFINATTHIQAPATAASSKRRASFEIGQRLPFHKDAERAEGGDGEDAVESDGDVDTTQEEQKRLTDEALKRLSSFGRFVPAEMDLSISTKNPEDEIVDKEDKIDTNIPFRTASASQIPPIHPSQMMRPLSAQSSRGLNRNVSNLSPVAQSDVDEDQIDPNANRSNSNKSSNSDYFTRSASPNNQKKFQTSLPVTTDIQSPAMVPTPSSNSSIDNANLKTINDPKRPMYVPAVLRQSNTNLKPEDVRHINEQNSRKSKSLLQEAAHSLRTQSSHWSLRFDGSSAKTPTRAHWRRDITRQSCALCDKSFTFFERRHHCRRCGDIFCAEHTSHLLKLGLDAQFTLGGKGILCKVCDNCCKDYETFVKRELGDCVMSVKRSTSMSVGGEEQGRQNSEATAALVGSVPADWSWSSF